MRMRTSAFKIPSPSASSSQASPIPSLSASSWPELGTVMQLSWKRSSEGAVAKLRVSFCWSSEGLGQGLRSKLPNSPQASLRETVPSKTQGIGTSPCGTSCQSSVASHRGLHRCPCPSRRRSRSLPSPRGTARQHIRKMRLPASPRWPFCLQRRRLYRRTSAKHCKSRCATLYGKNIVWKKQLGSKKHFK